MRDWAGLPFNGIVKSFVLFKDGQRIKHVTYNHNLQDYGIASQTSHDGISFG